jgi:hypothetical protein
VALSADGNTALIGGPGEANYRGAAWVFVRVGSRWKEEARLVGGGETGRGEFGQGVALSGSGGTAVVGAPFDDPHGTDPTAPGAVWVFSRSGAHWVQQGAKLRGRGENSTSNAGYALAISGDGGTVLFGGYAMDGYRGAAWVFTRHGSVWEEQGGQLPFRGATGPPSFGGHVALSWDGTTALVTGAADNHNRGAVWVLTRIGTHWVQQGPKLTGRGETGPTAGFGSAVALSRNGDTAIIGAFLDNNGGGAAFAFTRSGSRWTQQSSKLTGHGETGTTSQFGNDLALSANGTTAIIGGPYDDNKTGAVWTFTR